MASESQIEANRLNAQKSTGPRSAEGKARSSQNALKSGIDAKSEVIRFEDPAALQELTAAYYEEYATATSAERVQLKIMIRCEWLMDRYACAEAKVWESKLDYAVKFNKTSPMGDVAYDRDRTLLILSRKNAILHRDYKNATRELERLQNARRAAEAAEVPLPARLQAPDPEAAQQPQPIENKQPSIEIGFVPANSPAALGPRISPAAVPHSGLSTPGEPAMRPLSGHAAQLGGKPFSTDAEPKT